MWSHAPNRALAAVFLALGLVAFAGARVALADPPDANPAAGPPEPPVSLAYDATLASRYLFQGLDYSDGRTVVQPNFGATHGRWTLGVWGNVQPDLNVLNEVDLSLKASFETRLGSISPGYMVLRYPHRDWSPSQELFVDLSWKAPVNPTLSLHYDLDAGTGLYATLGASREVKAPLTLAANVFYQSGYYDMTGFPALELRASAALTAGTVTVTPALSRFLTWGNGDFRDELGVPSNWLFAVNVTRAAR